MIGHMLLTFYRISTRHPRYTLLNLSGLALGIAVFITLGLYVRLETGFEDWIPDVGKIYELGSRLHLPGRPLESENWSMGGMLDELHDDFPELVGTRLWELNAGIHSRDEVVSEKETIVDRDFFKLFDLPLIAGDKTNALEPGKIMLTEAVARKYFGRSDALGKTLRVSDDEGENSYVVSAILRDLPHDTELTFDFVRALTPKLAASRSAWHRWGASSLKTFLRFEAPADADNLSKQLDDFVNRKAGKTSGGNPWTSFQTLHLIPYPSLHLRDPRDRAAVVTLGLVGLLTFIIASINFINLTTARAGMRAREVAVRRTLGATQRSLRLQFLGEAFLMTLMALIGGLSLVELCLPLINAASGTILSLDYNPYLAGLIGAVLAMGLLSGVYPAFVLSAFQPAQILASNRYPSGGKLGMRVRETLVVLQFATVIVFFTMITGFVLQLNHMRTTDLGFRRDGLMITPSTYNNAVNASLRETVLAAFRATAGVQTVTTSNAAPAASSVIAWDSLEKPGEEGVTIHTQNTQVGPDFFQTYDAMLLAGRILDRSHPEDASTDKAPERNVVLTAQAAKIFGFPSPEAAIDQILRETDEGQRMHVVGVVGNLRFRSPKEGLPAQIFYFSDSPALNPVAAIRYEGVAEPEIRQRLQDAWRRLAPDVPLEITSATDSLDKFYKPDRNRSHLFELGALAAAGIGCIGLYGMAAFSISRRMLEVAMRKVLGASRGTVVKLLVGQFLLPVLLANLLAWPIGYVALSGWLGQFDDRIALGPLPFLAASGMALAVAIATIFSIAITSANAAPGRALRNE